LTANLANRSSESSLPLSIAPRPTLQSLYDEMAAQNPLIKVTYDNAQNGVVMPNIPQMGKFWSSMASAFQIATNGQASPEAALADAKKNMEK
jgi:maltose/maltodextrin transport system substrate-binding protein